MQHRDRFDMKSVLLALLLMCVEPWRHHGAQVDGEEANKPPDGGGGMAFFALRSCHQLLSGEEGEFFSPDYLCSNPPLWCNWTIQVDPGKRIHLRLEDLTPDDACHLKQDQIHVDDDAAVAAGHVGGHEILQGCWREAGYTSASNTLDVVLLIGGWPHPPYRGFYGHYRAFGPPVVYNPQEAFAVRDTGSGPPLGPMDIRAFRPAVEEEQGDSDSLERPSDDGVYDYYDQRSAGMAELTEEAVDPDSDPEGGENLRPASENYSHVYPFTVGPTEPASTLGTSRSGRGANSPPPSHSDSAIHVMSPQQQRPSQNRELGPAERPPGAVRRNVDEASTRTEEEEGGTQGRLEGEEPAAGPEPAGSEVTEATDRQPPTPEAPELQGGQQTHPRPNVVEPLSDHRWNLDVRNHSEIPHLPGDHLFEVAAEVNFSPDLEDSWDNLARSLLLSVKALISEQLEALHTPLSISSKRIKRLNAGALYILWLQIGPGPMGRQVHGAVHGAMQGLIAAHVGLGGSNGKATAAIVSVSTADVNECGTQLVLCDVNADCVNQFGSYSCRCRTGFLDESRLGSGGTACVDVKAAGCGSGPSTETKGIYVLFFLLSALVLMLLAAACTLYHRHRRGTFLVRCHSSGSVSPPDPNNNGNHRCHDAYPADPDLPPPPLPPRGPRGGWPQAKEGCAAVDLPLLRFSPLLPPDSYLEPREGGKT